MLDHNDCHISVFEMSFLKDPFQISSLIDFRLASSDGAGNVQNTFSVWSNNIYSRLGYTNVVSAFAASHLAACMSQ